MDTFADKIMEWIMYGLIFITVVLLAGLLAILGLAAWSAIHDGPPPAYVLDRGVWFCAREHERLVGKVFVHECDQYNHIA